MTGIVDYNAGNIRSVERALEYIKVPYILSKRPQDLKECDRLIFLENGKIAAQGSPQEVFKVVKSSELL